MTYLITRKDTYEIANAVYFADSLEDATALRDEMAVDGHTWVVAQLLEPQP